MVLKCWQPLNKTLLIKSFLTVQWILSQNGQTYFKNLAALPARFLKCVSPFWDIMY